MGGWSINPLFLLRPPVLIPFNIIMTANDVMGFGILLTTTIIEKILQCPYRMVLFHKSKTLIKLFTSFWCFWFFCFFVHPKFLIIYMLARLFVVTVTANSNNNNTSLSLSGSFYFSFSLAPWLCDFIYFFI